MRPLALVTLLAFGCTTVRVTALAPQEVVDGPGTIAPPVVELFLESSEEVPRREADAAAEAAQRAIAEALSGVRVAPDALGAADAVLFVRERGVALTGARESQQTLAKVAIVLGIVVAIVGVVAASKSGGGKTHFTRGAAGGPVVRNAGRPMVRPVVPHFYRAPPPVFVGFDFVIPVRPMVYAPDPDEVPFPPEGPYVYASAPPPGAEPAAGDDAGPPPPDDLPPLELPPLAPPVDFAVQERGFFDGPHFALQLDLVDRATGRLLWSKPIDSDGDPRDPRDVRKLLRSALARQAWAQPGYDLSAR